jgi:hypothetical protein
VRGARLHHRPARPPPSSSSTLSERGTAPCPAPRVSAPAPPSLRGTVVAPSSHRRRTFVAPSWQAFEQTLALARGTAAGSAGTLPPAAAHAPVAVDGPPTDVPPGLTAEERVAWERDGVFWRP